MPEGAPCCGEARRGQNSGRRVGEGNERVCHDWRDSERSCCHFGQLEELLRVDQNNIGWWCVKLRCSKQRATGAFAAANKDEFRVLAAG